MNLLKLQIGILLSLSKLYVGLLTVLAVIFHTLMYLQQQPFSELPLQQLMAVLVIPSSIFTLALAANLHKLKVSFLWSTNTRYRLSLTKAAYLLAVVFTLLNSLPLISVLNLWHILLVLGASLAFLDSGFGNFKGSVVIPTVSFLWLLAALANPNSLWLFALIIMAYGVTKLLINLDIIQLKQRAKQGHKARKVSSFNDPYLWSCKMARWFSPLANTARKDFDWMIAFPQTKLGVLAVYFGLITVPIAFVQKDIVALFMLYGVFIYTLSLQGLYDFQRCKAQLKPFAHLIGNSASLKLSVLLSLMKMMLVNLVIFTLISQLSASWLGPNGFSQSLLVFTSLLGALMCATTPWFICFNFMCEFKRVLPQLALVMLFFAVAFLLYYGLNTLDVVVVASLWLLMSTLVFVTGWLKYKTRSNSQLFAVA